MLCIDPILIIFYIVAKFCLRFWLCVLVFWTIWGWCCGFSYPHLLLLLFKTSLEPESQSSWIMLPDNRHQNKILHHEFSIIFQPFIASRNHWKLPSLEIRMVQVRRLEMVLKLTFLACAKCAKLLHSLFLMEY